MQPGDLVQRKAYPAHESDLWSKPCVIVKGPYEDQVRVTDFNNKPITVVRMVIDVLIDKKIHCKLPIYEFKKATR